MFISDKIPVTFTLNLSSIIDVLYSTSSAKYIFAFSFSLSTFKGEGNCYSTGYFLFTPAPQAHSDYTLAYSYGI